MARPLLVAICVFAAIVCASGDGANTVKKSEVSKNDEFINDDSSSKTDDKYVDDAFDSPDDLEAAENIVFRPLFRYRKQNVQKKRVYSNPQITTSKPYVNQNSKSPAPLLVYDPKTGSYYPVSSSYYSQFAASYPGYFGNVK